MHKKFIQLGNVFDCDWLIPVQFIQNKIVQKSVITVQKSVITLHKSVITVQKSVITVHKFVITVQKYVITVHKSVITVQIFVITVQKSISQCKNLLSQCKNLLSLGTNKLILSWTFSCICSIIFSAIWKKSTHKCIFQRPQKSPQKTSLKDKCYLRNSWAWFLMK